MVTHDEAVWAYRVLLEREPESETAIEHACSYEDLGALVRDLLASEEYLVRARGRLSAGDVAWAYGAFLERRPENEAVVKAHLQAGTLCNLIRGLLGSDEFRINSPGIFQLPNQWVLHESPHGFRLWVNIADVAVSGQIMRGTYEVDEVAFLSAQLKPGQSALDIGANIGYLSHVMAMAVGAEGRVISFEPHPVIHERLVMSIAENRLRQCTTHNVALGEVSGTGALEFGLDGANFGGMRLHGVNVNPGTRTVSVPTRRLDDLLDPGQRVDFVKIDVEGNEPLVFRGGEGFFRTQRPVIMSEILGRSLHEIHGIDAAAYVTQVCALGYRCHSLLPEGRIGEPFAPEGLVEFANVVFLPAT